MEKTKKNEEGNVVQAMEWYERTGNGEVVSTLVERGYLRTALGVMIMSHWRMTMRHILEWMDFTNHQSMLVCMKRMCPVLLSNVQTPYLTLTGLSNTSILPYHENKNEGGRNYLLNVRVVNYRLNDEAQFLLPTEQPYFNSDNLMLEVSEDLKTVVREKRFVNEDKSQSPYRGIEDIRLIWCRGQIHYIGTMFHRQRLMMTSAIYDPTRPSLEVRPIESPTHRQVEKNWCMFVNASDELRYVYQWSPFEIGRVEDNKLVIEHQKNYGLWFMSRIKGSSSGVYDPKTQCLWFLVHFHSDQVPRQYYHMIIQVRPNDYEIVRMSRPFLFEDTTIQFGMGLLVEEKRVVMTYTVFDRDARVVSYDRATLERLLLSDEHAVFTNTSVLMNAS